MSAVAANEQTEGKATLEAVTPSHASLAEKEMYRWMLWFGMPALVASIFVGIAFATDSMWWISGAVTAIIAAIGVLVWLAMSSCTNEN